MKRGLIEIVNDIQSQVQNQIEVRGKILSLYLYLIGIAQSRLIDNTVSDYRLSCMPFIQFNSPLSVRVHLVNWSNKASPPR